MVKIKNEDKIKKRLTEIGTMLEDGFAMMHREFDKIDKIFNKIEQKHNKKTT